MIIVASEMSMSCRPNATQEQLHTSPTRRIHHGMCDDRIRICSRYKVRRECKVTQCKSSVLGGSTAGLPPKPKHEPIKKKNKNKNRSTAQHTYLPSPSTSNKSSAKSSILIILNRSFHGPSEKALFHARLNPSSHAYNSIFHPRCNASRTGPKNPSSLN